MGQVTIGTDTYDIYGDEAGAARYFNASLSASDGWDNADADSQKKALVSATRMFDRTFWVGLPTEPVDKNPTPAPDTQPLQWPRTGAVDCDDVPVPDDEIPDAIIAGSYELANALLVPDNEVEETPSSGSNLKSDLLTEKVDVLQTTTRKEWFTPTGPGSGTPASRFPTAVNEYIRCFLSGRSGSSSVCATGLNDDSAFDDDWGFVLPGLP